MAEERKKKSRVKQLGGLGIIGILALLLARMQCGPGLGIFPGDGEGIVEQESAVEGSADADDPEAAAPLVLTITGADIQGPDGVVNLQAAVARATEAHAAGRAVELVPASDALDRAVHALTAALDEADVTYTIQQP